MESHAAVCPPQRLRRLNDLAKPPNGTCMRWPLAHGSAAYHPPHPGLLGCVRGYLVRDTTGLPVLPEAARRNCYPATACASLVWRLEGASAWAGPAAAAAATIRTRGSPKRADYSPRSSG